MTVDDACAAVLAAIEAAALDRSDGQPLTVTGYDPVPDTVDRPEAVAVTFSLMDFEEIGVAVRIYCSTATDVPSAETNLRRLTQAVDAALNTTRAPRSRWSKTWSAEMNAYVCESTLIYPRDDF